MMKMIHGWTVDVDVAGYVFVVVVLVVVFGIVAAVNVVTIE